MIEKGKNVRKKILDGINKTVDLSKITLGAMGKTVLIKDKFGLGFRVTKDGVSVIKDTSLEDPVENIGCEFVKQSSIDTVNIVGDSTTTTSILTQSLCNHVYKALENGHNANDIVKYLRKDLKTILKYISSKSKEITTIDEIMNIARIASNNDEEIGNLIKNIYETAGMNVQIDIVESDNTETDFEIVKGFILKDTGYSSNQFINNPEKGRVEFINPRVYTYNGNVKSMDNYLMDILEQNANRNAEDFRPTVIIVNDIDENVLREILMAHSQQMLHSIAIVQSNLIYEDRKNNFIDTSVFLNSEYTEDRFGTYGSCEKIVIEKEKVTFINGEGDTKKYLDKLYKEFKKTNLKSIEDRIFALESNAAIIKVGGKLTTEIDEKKDRIEDAVCAVKSALEEGYCPGGSTVYLFARIECDFELDFIFQHVLLDCYKQLMFNAEIEPFFYLNNIQEKGFGFGYNLVTNKVSNMYEDKILDSTKGLRIALENAVSTASTFATINGIIY